MYYVVQTGNEHFLPHSPLPLTYNASMESILVTSKSMNFCVRALTSGSGDLVQW